MTKEQRKRKTNAQVSSWKQATGTRKLNKIVNLLNDSSVRSVHLFQVLIYLKTPRITDDFIQDLKMSYTYINKMYHRNSDLIQKNTLPRGSVRNELRGKLPVQYSLTEEGHQLIDALIKLTK